DRRGGGGPDGPVALIGYRFWQERFGGAADAIGKTITLDRVVFTVVGVAPPEFFGPEVGATFDVAVPLGTEPLVLGRDSLLDDRSSWWLTMMVRLKPDQDLAQATAAWQAVQSELFAATVPPKLRVEDQKAYLHTRLVLNPAANGASYLRYRYQRPLTILS